MKNFRKKFVCLTTALSLSFGMTTYASADVDQSIIGVSTSANAFLKNVSKEFETMNNDELNQYINNLVDSSNKQTVFSASASSSDFSNSADTTPSLAWLAAAQILKNNGYTCAGELLKCSVNNQNYNESSIQAIGLCSKKIVTTSAFKTYCISVQ